VKCQHEGNLLSFVKRNISQQREKPKGITQGCGHLEDVGIQKSVSKFLNAHVAVVWIYAIADTVKSIIKMAAC
jgi:hypothetical protein